MPPLNLPALPNVTTPGGASNQATTPPRPTAPRNPGDDIGELATGVPDPSLELPELPAGAMQAQNINADSSVPTPPTDGNEPTDATADAGQAPPSLPELPTLPEPQQAALPELPMPGVMPVPGAPLPLPQQPGISFLPVPSATELPEISVVEEKKVKTWLTTLKPQVIPPKTNFNYRRVQLPSTIYRDAYDANNQHLPLRTTRDAYATLLFKNIARNDIEATRALLNAGTHVNVVNVFGETPLAFAQRAGAIEVAELLKARGGK